MSASARIWVCSRVAACADACAPFTAGEPEADDASNLNCPTTTMGAAVTSLGGAAAGSDTAGSQVGGARRLGLGHA